MKIINQTAWRTDHLKAILQKAAAIELEPAKRKVLTVKVVYTRGHYSSGCAWIGGRTATVRIRHPFSRKARRVWVPVDDPRPGTGGRKIAADGTVSEKTVLGTDPEPLDPLTLTDLKLHFASVAAHEFAHIRGADHATMSAKYKWHGNWREYVQWAADLPLEVKPVKAKARPTLDDKLAHTQRMLKLAVTRLKRAQTLAQKWKQRERRYIRTMAARSAEAPASSPQS